MRHPKIFFKDYEKITTRSKEFSKTLDKLFNKEEMKLSVPNNLDNLTLIQVSIAIR